MTLLNVLIVVLATLIGLLVLLWLLLRFALPWWLKRKIAAMADMPQGGGIAARITLMPIDRPWQKMQTAERIGQMLAIGFEEIGRYAVPEMPGMQLWAGHHPEDRVAAVIYDHNVMPVFYDIVRAHVDYSTCTVSTNPIHDPANVPPESRCIADPSLEPDAALVALRAQPTTGEQMPLDASNFEPVFLELYARSIDHILARRMPDAEHMRQVGERVSEATGQPVPQLDDRQMRMAVDMERQSRLSALQDAIVDRFLQSGQIDAREWERVRDRVAVVHDLLSREDAADLARGEADDDATEALVAAVLAEPLSAFETFEKISAAVPVQHRPRVLGEVDHPLYAQVLLLGY
ncbi:MAG: hypothetical protein ACOY82_17425 [Pseudomonadota bacterium]